jgi:phosphate transport system protein
MEARLQYHEQLRRVEAHIQAMGDAAQGLFSKAVNAVVRDDASLAERVIAGDDVIDEYYNRSEERIMRLLALQAPVAGDLRLLTALLHINFHLERIGDMAVNLAKIGKLAHDLPRSQTVATQLEEMGGIALRMIGAAMDSFARRDVELARSLPTMDDPLDKLNKGMLQEVLRIAEDKRMLEWGIRMHVVSRQIERVGDHAVDIAEQVAFVVTGELGIFSGPEHPIEGPLP